MEETMNYILSVTNAGEELTLHDIVLEDPVPEGMRIRKEDISVWLQEKEMALPLHRSARVSLEKKGQLLVFRIGELLPGETIHIQIPVMPLEKEATFSNTAVISTVNGVEKHLKSETVWHRTPPDIPVTVPTGLPGGPGAVWLFIWTAVFLTAGCRTVRRCKE